MNKPTDLGPASCDVCADYLARRGGVLHPAIAEQAERTDEFPRMVALRYMLGVHARHMSGLSLEVS